MFQDYGTMGGMHALWWLFWALIVIAVIFWRNENSSGRARGRRDTPLERLKHRLANGEINIEEFNAIKATLESNP